MGRFEDALRQPGLGAIAEINDFLTFDGQLFVKLGLPLMV